MTQEGPANKAGLKVQDEISAVDDNPVDVLPQFATYLFDKRAGDSVKLDVWRGSTHLTLNIPVVDSDTGHDDPFEVVDTESSFVPRLGIVCAPLNTAIPIPTVRLSWVPQLRGSHEAMALGTPPLRACCVRHHPDLASGGSSRLHLSRRLGPDRCPLPGVRTASARRNCDNRNRFLSLQEP